MRTFVAARVFDSSRPLTMPELDRMRNNGEISGDMYREAGERVHLMSNERMRRAAEYVRSNLQVPPPDTPDLQMSSAQKESQRVANGIMNDLADEMLRKPDTNVEQFVRQRLNSQEAVGTVLQRRNAQRSLDNLPAEVRTPEGLNRLAQQYEAYLAYLGLSSWERQFVPTVRAPRLSGMSAPLSAAELERYRLLQMQAGVDAPAASGASRPTRSAPLDTPQ
jgi:hypothetical protein